jgi:hypothetical protein
MDPTKGGVMPKITVEVNAVVYSLLGVLAEGDYGPETVEQVVLELIDHAQQGVYRPGAWEREWLMQAFGPDFLQRLEPGDPYGRSDCDRIFQRPIPIRVLWSDDATK